MTRMRTLSDNWGNGVPCIDPDDATSVAAGASSARIGPILEDTVYRFYGTQDLWFKKGDASVTAEKAAPSTPISKGIPECYIVLAGEYVAAIADSTTGTLVMTPANMGP